MKDRKIVDAPLETEPSSRSILDYFVARGNGQVFPSSLILLLYFF